MPTELYGTLYGHNNLYDVMTMLKDIYAKKPQNDEDPVPSFAMTNPYEALLVHDPDLCKSCP